VVNLLDIISEIASVATLTRNDNKEIIVIASETVHLFRNGECGNLRDHLIIAT
jgi:hypothetical protein